jgi:DNA-binding HxlR family transcriptional regulator
MFLIKAKITDKWCKFVTRYKKDTGYKKNTGLKFLIMIKMYACKLDPETCAKKRLAIQDTLDLVGGKWKLVLLTVLRGGKRRFKELSREVDISPRILSKELHELEVNGLVSRTVCDTKPVTVEYALTPYSETLSDVLSSMRIWGEQHRKMIIEDELVFNHAGR